MRSSSVREWDGMGYNIMLYGWVIIYVGQTKVVMLHFSVAGFFCSHFSPA